MRFAKANSKEICEVMSFPPFFRKMLMSAFLLRFKASYVEKLRGYPHFSLWIPILNSPCKDLLLPHGLNLTQKPLYLVGTILKGPISLLIHCGPLTSLKNIP